MSCITNLWLRVECILDDGHALVKALSFKISDAIEKSVISVSSLTSMDWLDHVSQ